MEYRAHSRLGRHPRRWCYAKDMRAVQGGQGVTRRYIRHPSDIPIEFQLAELAVQDREYLNNISYGGLSFRSQHKVPVGAVIAVRIPLVEPEFEARGRVTWCRRHGDQYDVGVEFIDPEEAFHSRMVEQICHIEHYKNEILQREGRQLTGEEAALEWIRRYAASFPKVGAEPPEKL